MADEPPVNGDTPETPNTPETSPTEKTSHTTRNALIIVLVIVVILALFFGLFFGLRGCDNDEPDDVNPDPEIVEPGPEDPNSEGDDGEPTHTEHSWVWEHDDEGHWQVCSVCGETTTKNSHTLSYTKGNDTSHTVKCDTCGYEATKEHTLEYVSDGTTGHHQVCSECQYATATVSHDLGSYISDGNDGHYQECSLCDYKSEGNHTWIETSTTPATCTTEGATYYKCELCGATKTTVIPALGHNWSSEWSYDATNHWHACTHEGCTAKNDETPHILGEQAKNSDGNYCQTCSVCGYSTDPVTPVATYINITNADSLTIHYNNSEDTSTPETLNLRSTIIVTILDQYNNEYTGTSGSEYTLSTESEYISLSEDGVVTGVSEGTAVVTVKPKANENVSTTINIEVIPKEYEVESITASIEDGETNSDGNILLDWGATSDELQVTFNPTYATVQTYEVTPNDETGLFTYDKTTNTFTHTRSNTGTETFVITATDQSNSAYTTITLECDPVIDEPYEVVWRSDEEHSLPETIAKGESITDLDNYVEVHFNHENQDEHEYEDDTYTLSYAGSEGVTISGTTATFTGNGGTEVYITVTATPAHDSELSQTLYAVSSGITITQAVTDASLNYTKLNLCYYHNRNDLGDYYGSEQLEVTYSPSDAQAIISWESSDTNIVNVSDEGLVTVTGKGEGTATITASIKDFSTLTCTVNVYDFSNIGTFADETWENIDNVSTCGMASTFWSVGDTKTIAVGEEEEYDIRIIGFDHDELTTADENYNDGEHAAITCEMVDCLNTTTHAMNNTATNVGGWASSEMRAYLNTEEGCVLSTLDSDLRSVIKKVDKKSTAGGNSTSLGETSSDSLFLLAHVELTANTNSGYKSEGTQYAYYSTHSSASDRVKNRNGGASSWWLRSPSTTKSDAFWYVANSGTITGSNNANATSGVSFAFCI